MAAGEADKKNGVWLLPPRDPVAALVIELVEPLLEGEGFSLVHLEYRGGKQAKLRIFVDRAGRGADAGDDGLGVTIKDLTALTRLLSDALDVADPVPSNYELEVSSPGLDRPLARKRDFEAVVGQLLSVRTSDKIEGRRRFSGELVRVEDEAVALRVDGQDVSLPADMIAKANLEYRPPARRAGGRRSRSR